MDYVVSFTSSTFNDFSLIHMHLLRFLSVSQPYDIVFFEVKVTVGGPTVFYCLRKQGWGEDTWGEYRKKLELQGRIKKPGSNFITYYWLNSMTKKVHFRFEHNSTTFHRGRNLIEHPIISAFPDAPGQ
jgi:hypothetical protein